MVEATIDRLETFSLGKWSSGNFYLADPGCSLPHKGTKTGKTPAFCKLFSLSSCSSQASSLLREPKQSIGLELVDKKGKRLARIFQNEMVRKGEVKQFESDY